MSDAGLFGALEARGFAAHAVSDAALVRAMLRTEAALAIAQADAGVIPAEHAQRIVAVCQGVAPTDGELEPSIRATGAPVLGLVEALRARVGTDAAASVHRGATTQDVMDTSMMLTLSGAIAAIRADLLAAASAAADLAERHRATPILARTLLQPAMASTFGAKAAGWLSGLDEAIDRLGWVERERLAAQLGGAIGSASELGPDPEEIVGTFASLLGLPVPALAWHTERSRVVDVSAALGLAAASAGKVALDVALLSQGEVGEVTDADPDRGGSSAMPHKRNPIAAVAARAAAMQAPGLVAGLVATAGSHEHERAAGALHAEWPILRQLARTVGSAVAWVRDTLEHVVPDEERMAANLADAGVPSDRPDESEAAATRIVQVALVRHRALTTVTRPSRLHLVDEGPRDRPIAVLVGSLGSTLEMWTPQVPRLAGQFRVIRVDLRGHGGSAVPPPPYTIADLGGDLAGVITGLNAGPVHLVGSSIGGMGALWVAAHAPELVERLALVGTSARLGPAGAWMERASTVLAGGMDAVKESVVRRWVTPAYAEAHPEAIAAWQAMVGGIDPAGYAGCCVAIAGMDQSRSLAEIRAPTLIIVGDQDPATPIEHARRMAERIPRARLEVMNGAAHLPNLEDPERFTDLLLEHLS